MEVYQNLLFLIPAVGGPVVGLAAKTAIYLNERYNGRKFKAQLKGSWKGERPPSTDVFMTLAKQHIGFRMNPLHETLTESGISTIMGILAIQAIRNPTPETWVITTTLATAAAIMALWEGISYIRDQHENSYLMQLGSD